MVFEAVLLPRTTRNRPRSCPGRSHQLWTAFAAAAVALASVAVPARGATNGADSAAATGNATTSSLVQKQPAVEAVTVFRTSQVTSWNLGKGISIHLRPLASGNPADRVFIHAFLPLAEVRSPASGHEIGMLAAAVLGDAGPTDPPPAPPRPQAEGGEAPDAGATPQQPAASRTGPLRAWLGADGLHLRIAGPKSELGQLLAQLREALQPEVPDPLSFSAAQARELQRLRAGQGGDREVIDKLLAAVNPAYRRPDATIMTTVTHQEVRYFLAAMLGGQLADGLSDAPVNLPPISIGISGPVSQQDVSALLNGGQGRTPLFGEFLGNRIWHPGTAAVRGTPVQPVQIIEGPSPDPSRGLALLAWEAPPLSDLAGYRASLAATRLVQRRLRERLGGSHPGVNAQCTLMPGPGTTPSTVTLWLRIPGGAKAAKADGDALNLADLAAEAVASLAMRGNTPTAATAAEIDEVTDPLVNQSTQLLASPDYWSTVLSTHRWSGIDPDDLVEAPTVYDNLKPAELSAAAANWLDRGLRLRLVRIPGTDR
jgi:hypothetical protein